MQLINRIETALWNKFDGSKYVNVRRYIQLWQQDVFNDFMGEYEGKNLRLLIKKTLRQLIWVKLCTI